MHRQLRFACSGRQLTAWTRAAVTAALVIGAPAIGDPTTFRPARTAACARGGNSYDDAINAAVSAVTPVWRVPVSFVKAVIQQESAFQERVVSPAGAVGLMQVLPSNARRLGLRPEALWLPTENILAGTRLLAVLLRHYQGDVISALVAYNARPRRRSAPVPDNGETPGYVRGVLRAWAAFRRCEERRNEAPTSAVRPGAS
jgi:soluble lytic murein transglycosylase-like protein